MLQVPCCEDRESTAMKTLYNALKDHKNPMIQDLINSSYEHCCRGEMEILIGDGDLLDSAVNCGTESAARVCLVNPAFNSPLQLALKTMQDAKLVIDQFGFSLEYLNSAPENDDTRLSHKLTVLINNTGIAIMIDGANQRLINHKMTVLINDIGMAIISMEYALFRGKEVSDG